MGTATLTNRTETKPASFVLVNGYAYGIQLPNGTLYREWEARQADPLGAQPTVWFGQDTAEGVRTAIAVTLEEVFGIDPDGPSALRVVRLEMDTDGIWKPVRPTIEWHVGYRPVNPDTEEVSLWPCTSKAVLSVADARQVLSDHRECAGPITCRIRGRARARLARAGLLRLIANQEKAARAWLSLSDADTPWGWRDPVDGPAIGGSALVHLVERW